MVSRSDSALARRYHGRTGQEGRPRPAAIGAERFRPERRKAFGRFAFCRNVSVSCYWPGRTARQIDAQILLWGSNVHPCAPSDLASGLRPADARTFASLYAVESFARATVSSVIPIQAYEIFHNEQIVSILYTIVALLGLSVTLFMPMLIRRFARRWVYTAGACLLAIGSLFFVTHTLTGQLAGMLCRVMGASALSITLNLYIMDHIRKTDFMQAESLRMAWSMLAWTGGPTLGIFLYTRFGIYAAHGAVAVFAMALLALFWTTGWATTSRSGRARRGRPIRSPISAASSRNRGCGWPG